MRVLVIEDDPLIRAYLERVLRFEEYVTSVDVSDNALHAINALATAEVEGTPFDLVISDYNIAGSTGGDVLEWIRTHISRLENRFLFLSDDDRAEAMHRHFLRKPARTSQILSAINSLLNQP